MTNATATQNQYAMQDPLKQYPQPEFEKQPQPEPGLAQEMTPKPDHGEESYKGFGRLAGHKALGGLDILVNVAGKQQAVENIEELTTEQFDQTFKTNVYAMMQKFPIAIVGAGFGGLQAAQSLAQSGKDILLIDRHNYHTFVPLLYQVATAQLEPEHIIYPVRTIIRRSRRCHFLLVEVEKIDLSARIITTDRAEIQYDFLVLATGSKSQYLGVSGAKEYAFSMNSLQDAVALRDRILECFEADSIEADPLRRQQLLTFVIIGGGATGTEVAGALVELLRSRIRHEYPTLNLRQVKLILLQSGDRLLGELPPKLGIYVTSP